VKPEDHRSALFNAKQEELSIFTICLLFKTKGHPSAQSGALDFESAICPSVIEEDSSVSQENKRDAM
jgi:hypothetical protein